MQAAYDERAPMQTVIDGALGGRWKVLGRIGAHPYGSVYEATDLVSGQHVELEVLRRELFASLDFWALNEFIDENFAPLGQLSHRTIDSCISFGIHEGLPYLLYEKSSQFNLRSLIKSQGPLPLGTVQEVTEDLLFALVTAHRSEVLHLGLAPERILLTLDSSNSRIAVLRGFGIASGLAKRQSNMSVLTKTGLTIAPAEYMAPELFVGQSFDERSDLYSLGAILYEMLTGFPPYQADTTIDLLLALRAQGYTPIATHRPELADEPFVRFVERLLSKHPKERPSSASVCLTALKSMSEMRRSAPSSKPSVARKTVIGTEQPLDVEPPAAPQHLSSAKRRSGWIGPVVLTAVLLNGVLALLLVRATYREREVTELARIEEQRAASRSASEEAKRARLATEKTDISGLVATVPRAAQDATEARKAESSVELKPEQAEAPLTFDPRRIRALGLSVRRVDPAFVEEHGLLNADGLLVVQIEEKGPAYQAGLRMHDILQYTETAGESILSWTPERLLQVEELVRAVERARESDTRLALVIKRGSYDGLVVFIRDFLD